MRPVDPARVREVFEATMDLPADRRAVVLDARCGGDALLRAEVESLLRHHDATHVLLSDRQAGFGARLMQQGGADAPAAAAGLPERIGHYRILRRLGAGGMGVVYLAEQDDPRRTVAVKVMRGDILTPELLKRFKREAHVLGQLQHPGIAHIYDAGATELDGLERAYFAMEYIDGVPLTEFAARQHLGSRARLELVALVCDAVQHAHERGIVHRDLKPGNILVDASGRPRVLDFGVARATGASVQTMTLQTEAGQLVGTLQYMSPEQIGGAAERVDARSDVYALGVVAFELLTGNPPYRLRDLSMAEVARTIQEVEPTRISALDTSFRGDIETILAKALEKDRSRRYATAADLASDIRRHLSDQPIVARPATTLYRLGKFARRNKALVAGTAIAFLALTAGLISTTILYLQADQARAQAEEQTRIAVRESAIAKATSAFVVQDMLAAPNPWTTGGREMTVASVLDRAARGVADRFAEAPQVEAAVRTTLGESYAALGLFAEAQPQFDRAVAILTQGESPDPDARLAALRRQANNLQSLGRFDEAEKIIVAVLDASRRASGADSLAVAESMEVLADVQIGQSRYAESEQTMREVVRIRRLLTPEGDLDLARATNTLGSTLHFRGDRKQAEAVKLDALAQFRRLLGETHPLVAQVLNDLGAGMVEQDRFTDAITYFEQALPLLIEQLGPEHRVVLACQRSLGTALSFNGQHAEAAPLLEKSIADSERSLGPDHPETLAAINCLATSYLRTERPADAAPLLQSLLERSEKTLGPLHAESLKYLHNLAWSRQKAGQIEEAENLFREALAGFEATLGPLHPDTHTVLDALAWNMERQKRYSEAARFMQRMLDLQQEALIPEDMETALFLNRLGTYWMQAGDYAAARRPLARCVELCRGNLAEHDWRLGVARGKYGETLSNLGERAAAEAELRASLKAFRTDAESPAENTAIGLKRLIAHYERTGEHEKAEAAKAELESGQPAD